MNTSTEHNPFLAPQAALDDTQALAESVFKLNLFSATGRIGRIRYLGYSMGFTFLIMLLAGILSAFITPAAIALAYIVMAFVGVMLAIKRSHDFNVTGWLSLLVFVPLVNLLFVFIPGTDGSNRFGKKTAPNGRAGVVIFIAVAAIPLIGILAAIALPAYQQYTQRAHAAQAEGVKVPAGSMSQPSATSQ